MNGIDASRAAEINAIAERYYAHICEIKKDPQLIAERLDKDVGNGAFMCRAKELDAVVLKDTSYHWDDYLEAAIATNERYRFALLVDDTREFIRRFN